MSDTKNVKIGVCQVFFDGVDLGFTQGGVEVTVKSETHKTFIDQFGKTPINEYVQAREAMVKVPLAETTIENLAMTMPGTDIVEVGGAVASGSIAFASNPAANDTVVINGTTITFVAGAPADAHEVQIGATTAATVTNLVAALNASADPNVAEAVYSLTAPSTLSIKWGAQAIGGMDGVKSVKGNDFTLAAGTGTGKTVTQMSGGADPTSRHAVVGTGVGNSLLEFARELRLHPVGRPLSDKSEDFVLPLAACAGALNFAYKVDAERTFPVEFTGYPTNDGTLFTFGK
jgi:hypothetical protein